jgi:hypothetical protein
MTNAELLAIAVLKGDECAVVGLVDAILEARAEAGGGEAMPMRTVQRLSVPVGRVRVAAFMKDRASLPSRQEQDRLRNELRAWICGDRTQIVLFYGVDRIEIYEVPENFVSNATVEEAVEKARAAL